ncbi:GNAT family N-acetyltransferase [Alkalibacterium sp. f15]|uniref:GNAT family N-acetyltransferase n=1 Tax=Alkalibacterium sp. f15 TaxID=3414029 RepID=UPI003BF893F8
MNLYFNEKYGKLYEKHERAEVVTFVFENEHGKITHMFMKKEIPIKVNNTIYYDVFTPYGYGGPLILKASNIDQLIRDYQTAFTIYCKKQRIVSEFIRFHPIENQKMREQFNGQVDYVGPQIVRDLSDPVEENISKRTLRYYRRNKHRDIKTVYDSSGTYLDGFLEIYYSTMEKNNAQEYYYFDRQFFENLNIELKDHYVYVHIFMDDLIIASELILFGETYSYGFLKGTRKGYYEMNPNINMEIDGIKFLKEKAIKYYILGGGHKSEDGIYQFKKKFAENSDYHYYIGKKTHDLKTYEKLVKIRFNTNAIPQNILFFPAYRAPASHLDTPIFSNN